MFYSMVLFYYVYLIHVFALCILCVSLSIQELDNESILSRYNVLPLIGNLQLITRAFAGETTSSMVTNAKGDSFPFAWLEVANDRHTRQILAPWCDEDITWLPKLVYLVDA